MNILHTVLKSEITDLLKDKGFNAEPTIANAIGWIYEKHNLWIDVCLNQYSKPNNLQWIHSITFLEDCTYSNSRNFFDSPIAAYESVIENILKERI